MQKIYSLAEGAPAASASELANRAPKPLGGSLNSLHQHLRMEHDVFLSFRGDDAREDFIGYLHRALCVRNIKTFIDYEIPRGKEISRALPEAIKKSRMSIVVLSPDYASSTWCLDELVQIVECMTTIGQLVHPVFRGTEPSEVQKLDDGCYGESLARHEEEFKNDKVKVKRWKLALFDVASLPGSHYKNGSEADFIQGIVKEVGQKLNGGPSRRLSGRPEQYRLSGTGSRDDLQMLAGKTGHGEREAKRINVVLGSPQEAHTKLLGKSSCQKESGLQQNEGFMRVLPSFAPSPSNVLSNVRHSEELGAKERESILNRAEATTQQNSIWAEITFAQIVTSTANQGLTSKQSEGGLNSLELNRNDFGSNLNSTNMEGLFISPRAEYTVLSGVQDAGNPSGETTCTLQLLQTFVSKGFPELLHPEGSNFIEETLNSLLNLSEDYKISMRTRSAARQLRSSFIQWSQDYEYANITVHSTAADLLKYSNLVKHVATTVKESKKDLSSDKEICSQLACLKEKKSQLEKQLMDVTAEITVLNSCERAASEEKGSLLGKERELEAKLDDSLIRVPILRAKQKEAMLTKAYIEAEWSKLKNLFENILMMEFGSS